MSIGTTSDRLSERRIDARSIAQASAIGALADQVVEDLLWSRATNESLSDSRAVRFAAELLSMAATGADEPRGLWHEDAMSVTLRKVTSEQGIPSQLARDAPARSVDTTKLEAIAAALQRVAAGAVSDDDLEAIRAYFEALAAKTLRLAASAVRDRGTADLWSTR